MPIYAYKCADCGHEAEVLQKISDAPLTVCAACGQPSMTKQVTAAGFQLKGSGWYATDFRNNGTAAKPSEKAEGKTESASDAKVDVKSDTKADSKTDSKADAKVDAKAGAPAPKKDAPAARGPASGTGTSGS
jgi:putative FmdB family regulatory protein